MVRSDSLRDEDDVLFECCSAAYRKLRKRRQPRRLTDRRRIVGNAQRVEYEPNRRDRNRLRRD